MKRLRKYPYWYLLAIPVLLFVLGAASNQAVLIANHGKFPVMYNEEEMSLSCSPDSDEDEGASKFSVIHTAVPDQTCANGGQFLDRVHSIMGPNSHLKALADVFDLGDGVYSIGDFAIMLGQWLWTYTSLAWLVLTVKKLAKLVEEKEKNSWQTIR